MVDIFLFLNKYHWTVGSVSLDLCVCFLTVVLPLYFTKIPPYIAYHPLFPNSLSPSTPSPTAISVVLFLWLNGWSCYVWYAILFNNIMDKKKSRRDTLVPEWPWCVFYATSCKVYWGLTHHVVFCWYSDLISLIHIHTSTHRHIAHSGVSRMTHPYKYIFEPPVMCSQKVSL